MTNAELKQYYADLLIVQYRGKPKADATVQMDAGFVIMEQLPQAVQDAFDLETAEGVQLDTIGTIVGVSRYGYTFTGPIRLDDDDFRIFIRMAIISNNVGSSLYDIQALLQVYFAGTILVYDQQNMHMGYFFDAAIGSRDLAEMFVKQGLLPKPTGVQLAAMIYSPDIDNFFGFITYLITSGDFGFNSYIDYDEHAPWLSYADAIGA